LSFGQFLQRELKKALPAIGVEGLPEMLQNIQSFKQIVKKQKQDYMAKTSCPFLILKASGVRRRLCGMLPPQFDHGSHRSGKFGDCAAERAGI
jgi:hypothetical protein